VNLRFLDLNKETQTMLRVLGTFVRPSRKTFPEKWEAIRRKLFEKKCCCSINWVFFDFSSSKSIFHEVLMDFVVFASMKQRQQEKTQSQEIMPDFC
jgi:hypothetical protein